MEQDRSILGLKNKLYKINNPTKLASCGIQGSYVSIVRNFRKKSQGNLITYSGFKMLPFFSKCLRSFVDIRHIFP